MANILQHNIERFGMVTVMDVVLYDITTKEPKLFLDTLKMTNISTDGNNKEIRGGIGADLLISYDYGRTANIEMQDALLSPLSLSLLWGKKSIGVLDTYTVNEIIAVGGSLSQTAKTGTLYTYSTEDGSSIQSGATTLTTPTQEIRAIYEVTNVSTGSTTMSYLTPNPAADVVISVPGVVTSVTDDDNADADVPFVYHDGYITIEEGDCPAAHDLTITYNTYDGSMITLTNDDFPEAMRLVGNTFVIDEATGTKKNIQIEIPKFKINSNFSFSMDAEGDASVFDFNGVALASNGELIKFKYLG